MSFHKWMEFEILINPSFGFQKADGGMRAVTSMEMDQHHQQFQPWNAAFPWQDLRWKCWAFDFHRDVLAERCCSGRKHRPQSHKHLRIGCALHCWSIHFNGRESRVRGFEERRISSRIHVCPFVLLQRHSAFFLLNLFFTVVKTALVSKSGLNETWKCFMHFYK